MKRKSLIQSLDITTYKSRRLDVEIAQDDSMVDVVALEGGDAGSVNFVDNWRHQKDIVLYNNAPRSLPLVPEIPTFVFDSQLIPGIRDHLYWPGKSKTIKSIEDNMDSDRNSEESSNCLAVVPWVATQPTIYSPTSPQPTGTTDGMDTEPQADMMDIEGSSVNNSNADATFKFSGMLQGWQERQQHCIEPQPFQNNSSTVYL